MHLLPIQNIPEVPTYSFALILLSTATSARVLRATSILLGHQYFSFATISKVKWKGRLITQRSPKRTLP